MKKLFTWVVLACIGCGGSSDAPAPISDHEVLVRIEVGDDRATQVSYRVWSERHELVADVMLPAMAFPRWLRLFPRAQDDTAVSLRWARVEVELWTEANCPFARRTQTYRYGEVPRSTTLRVGEEHATGSPSCAVRYVDSSDPGASPSQGCSLEVPCGTIQQAIGASAEAEDRQVVLVAPGVYSGIAIRKIFADDRTLLDPNVIRTWPGRSANGATVIRGDSPVSMCCGTHSSNPSPHGVEVDGFTVEDGVRAGIEINSSTEIRIRNCEVRRNVSELAAIDRAGIRIIGGRDIELEHNLVSDSGGSSLPPPVAGVFVGFLQTDPSVRFGARLLDNRIVGNQDSGVHVTANRAPVELRGNTLCENGDHGVFLDLRGGSADGRMEIEGNALLNNGSTGASVEWAGPVQLAGSTFFGNPGGSYENLGFTEPMVDGTNLVDPSPPPTVSDCLVAPLPEGPGVCPGFPDCS